MQPIRKIATLVRAGITFQQSDGELWGVLSLAEKEGTIRQYGQYLPCIAVPNPPGWDSIEALTGVTAEAVKDGWDDKGTGNVVADRAFSALQDHLGCEFLICALDGIDGFSAVELTPLRTTEAGLVPVDADLLAVAQPDARPARTTEFAGVFESLHATDAEPPGITITTADAPPLTLEVPDSDHTPDPAEYWFLEVLTEIPASQLAASWVQPTPGGQKASGAYRRCLARVEAALADQIIPLDESGNINLELLRRQIVRTRFLNGREPMLYTGRHIKVMVQRTWTLLKDTMGTHLFRANVQRGADTGTPAIIRMADGQAKLEVLDDIDKLRAVVATCIQFVRPGRRGSVIHVNPSQATLQHMLTLADQTVNPIDTLVRIPTMRADGTIHDRQGYDRRSRVWYAPELLIEDVPDSPTDAELRAAVVTVAAPFTEFPYVSDASRTAAIACLLEQVVRPMIDGPRPLYAFDAPGFRGQGTGKTLLPMAIGAVITGRRVGVTTWPDDPKEFPKVVTAKLLEADPFVIFDNLEGTVKHKDLAALTTSQTWSNRLLHTNETPRLAQTATWCLTLNGAKFNRDIARRTVLIQLDAKIKDPHKRKGFEIENLVTYCIRLRARIIRSLLIMARSWVVAGARPDDRLTWGSFEGWCRIVGGILRHAGLGELPEAVEAASARDNETKEHEQFIRAWAEAFPNQDVTALMLAELAERMQLYARELERIRAPNWRARVMAGIVRDLAGHEFGEGWLVHANDARVNGQRHFKVISPEARQITSGEGNPY